jgi:hypothetical protein
MDSPATPANPADPESLDCPVLLANRDCLDTTSKGHQVQTFLSGIKTVKI